MEPTRPDAQQYLVQLLEQAPVGVVRLDAEGAVASANPAACELLDQAERALISRPFGSLFEDSDTIGKTVMETLATGDGTTVVTRRGPTESGRHVELNVQRFRAEGTGSLRRPAGSPPWRAGRAGAYGGTSYENFSRQDFAVRRWRSWKYGAWGSLSGSSWPPTRLCMCTMRTLPTAWSAS